MNDLILFRSGFYLIRFLERRSCFLKSYTVKAF